MNLSELFLNFELGYDPVAIYLVSSYFGRRWQLDVERRDSLVVSCYEHVDCALDV